MKNRIIPIAFVIVTLAGLTRTNDVKTTAKHLASVGQYPKVLLLVPKDYQSEYTLNERDSLTNKVKTGWVMGENENRDFLVYLAVSESIASLDDIQQGFIFFTTNIQYCELSGNSTKNNENSDLVRLKFLKGRSKFLPQTASSPSKRWSNQDTLTTLLVAEFNLQLRHNNHEYYTCVHFMKKSDSAGADVDQTRLKFVHQGTNSLFTQFITTKNLLPLYAVCIFYFVLLCFSALFSGLNLGLMSLDLTELNLLKKIGNAKEKIYASKIEPLRRKGNVLLCTILLGNVLVNSTSTLILGNYLEGAFAAMGSTILIVLFGEIIPQAICSRHGLAVGTYTRYITYTIMMLTFFVSYPLGKILDFFLGEEIATTYSREKVRELMSQAKESNLAEGFKEEQFKMITGALEFKNKTVEKIMVPIRNVFSLDINSILDFETFKTILYHGYSRIPVYEHTPENLVGIILIQDLLLNDPADGVPLKAVMEYYKHKVPKCKPTNSLEEMFDKFRKGDSHMAFVYDEKTDLSAENAEITEAVGIVTLENVIEALVQIDILDEADKKREKRRNRAKQILKGKLGNISLSNENLNIFVTEEDQTNKPLISSQIRKALFYFLSSSVRPFTPEYINPRILETLLRQPELTIEKRNLSQIDNDKSMYLYEYGVVCDYFIIILDGDAKVEVGKEGMEINAGLFSYYGIDALLSENEKDLKCIEEDANRKPYSPEFSLIVNSYCVYLKVKRATWKDAVKKTMMERMFHNSTLPLSTSRHNVTSATSNPTLHDIKDSKNMI